MSANDNYETGRSVVLVHSPKQRIEIAAQLNPDDFTQNQQLVEMLLNEHENDEQVLAFVLGRLKVEEKAALCACVLIACENSLSTDMQVRAVGKLLLVEDEDLKSAGLLELHEHAPNSFIKNWIAIELNRSGRVIRNVSFTKGRIAGLREYLAKRQRTRPRGDT